MSQEFIGENLLPGRLGHFFVMLSFVAMLLAMISYYFASTKKSDVLSWIRMARVSFAIHSISLLGIVATLFYIIYFHRFEYFYAWSHSSTSLPTHFIISCFWEGQEGSFLLWGFWQMVLGWVVIKFSKDWEPHVMTIICLSQVFLASMLLGVYVFDFRIGSTPFILLRNAMDAPIFSRPDYLQFIKDGNGLNPLLQNYWMVIHPPTLFLGFASTIVPFAYAIAGIWRKEFKAWIPKTIPWALFSVMILGTGIIMGAFWAYEALNFGGYWAWDPVENASIIPWLILIGGVHVLLISKSTGHSILTSFILILLGFVLVLYASFLTRSGILGDSSVHAFTDLGMSGQLLVFLGVFLVLPVYLLIKNRKNLPIKKDDESTYSREFWMFIGSLVLIISCIQVLATTSIPVFNAIAGTNLAPPTDPIAHYNKWQLPIAVIILILSGFTQYLKYKKTEPKVFWIQVTVATVASLIISLGVAFIGDLATNVNYLLLMFACFFSVIINLRLLVDAFKGKLKLAGSAVAHIGFALMLLGALISSTKKDVISINTSGINYGEGFDDKANYENILLWRHKPLQMGSYRVTYKGDSTVGPNIFYKVQYEKLNDTRTEVVEEFTLYPNAQINEKMGLIASPDTRHYLTKDIYTHVTQVIIPDKDEDPNAYGEPVKREMAVGDTMYTIDGYVLLTKIVPNAPIKDIKLEEGDLSIGATLEVFESGEYYQVMPIYLVKKNRAFSFPALIEKEGLRFNFLSIKTETGKVELEIAQKKSKQDDYIIMKALVFPYINLLWGGTIIMIFGFILSIFRRLKEARESKTTK